MQVYQLSLPLLSLALYHLLLGYCYPPWYIGDSYDSLKIESFELSTESERVLKIQSESMRPQPVVSLQLVTKFLNASRKLNNLPTIQLVIKSNELVSLQAQQ